MQFIFSCFSSRSPTPSPVASDSGSAFMPFSTNDAPVTPTDFRRTTSSFASPTSKRKLEDCPVAASDNHAADLVTVRMRQEEYHAVNRCSMVTGASSSSSCSVQPAHPTRLQFFVRMISGGKTMVIRACPTDTVESIHERIQKRTRIPINEQRLIYQGKQLQRERSLVECSIQNDATVHLVGRMRSTNHPQAWQLIDDIISIVCRLCKGELVQCAEKIMKTQVKEYLSKTPRDEEDNALRYLQIFPSSSVPVILIMLYMSPIKGNQRCAMKVIECFLVLTLMTLPTRYYFAYVPVVLKFCKLLRTVSTNDPLYLTCRSYFGAMLDAVYTSNSMQYNHLVGSFDVQEIFSFFSELADRLSSDLVMIIDSSIALPLLERDVHDFSIFLRHLQNAIGFECPTSAPLQKKGHDDPKSGNEVEQLHQVFEGMLIKTDNCLAKMEGCLADELSGDSNDVSYQRWSQYFAILKEVYAVSKLFVGSEEQFWTVMKTRKHAICTLILRFVKRSDDNLWLLEHKEVTNFEARRHLVMMLLPKVKQDFMMQHEMLIERSNLLAESFEYVAHAEPNSLHAGFFMAFKKEKATGPGVLREWFFLVFQALFNQQNALFVSCPNDRTRFYPNSVSEVNRMHLDYFNFAGRMIGLALMHKMQVGIVLDRVLFLQLAGLDISLEDIKDADPFLYSSCKQILEMDSEFVDSDALGLNFVREVEELGQIRVVDLCPGGKDIVVDSKNRGDYVNLLIKHRFVTSISEQVSKFAKGFADIISSSRLQMVFFRSLYIEDLDRMLRGSGNDISLEDWKAHTAYNGYKETDDQILWFWKVVGEMGGVQRQVLLFFWTSVKYLPVEGFRGLSSKLHIYKSTGSVSRLPTSHTCFFSLYFPQYPSLSVMQDRLRIIVQEHVGCSFGTP